MFTDFGQRPGRSGNEYAGRGLAVKFSPLGSDWQPVAIELSQRARPRGYLGVPKRVFDVAVALAILPVAAPLLAVLWLAVRLDGGPGLFLQDRVGRNGRVFRCWKLRTMAVDAEARLKRLCAADPEIAREWQENQKLANDPRVTRIGRFLRKTSLDELPQLVNILRGDMSVVGPRPFLPEQLPLYVAAGGRAYFYLRPGVTGPWQVEGRGKTRFVDRVSYDEDYFAEASVRTDLRLILETVHVLRHMTGH